MGFSIVAVEEFIFNEFVIVVVQRRKSVFGTPGLNSPVGNCASNLPDGAPDALLKSGTSCRVVCDKLRGRVYFYRTVVF